MGHRNGNLSFIVDDSGPVYKGRGVVLDQTTGKVAPVTSINDPIIGWSQEDKRPGEQVSVRTMFEGTVMVELDRTASGGDYHYPGQQLTMTADGRMKRYDSAEKATEARWGFLLTNNRDATGNTKYGEALMLRQINLWDNPTP